MLKLFVAVAESVTSRLISPPSERIACSNAACALLNRAAHKPSAQARFWVTAASIMLCEICRIDAGMLDAQGQLERGWLECLEFGDSHDRTSEV
jgi:hypothetical protein